MKIHIASIFDRNHLIRAVTLHQTLHEHAPSAQIHFLCLDEESYTLLKKMELPHTKLYQPEDLHDAELLESRKNRSNPEFASTAKPAFLNYLMESGIIHPEDLLGFIDPDFLFYMSPQSLFEKIYQSGSITITPHRFPASREHEQYAKGIFNAGMVFFKKTPLALTCLNEWRKQCIEWCYLRYEDGKIGDQGYLSAWPTKYKGVYILEDKGVNLSTWNISRYAISTKPQNTFLIDTEPLICYHFHGLRMYINGNDKVRFYPATIYNRNIYSIYRTAIQKSTDRVREIEPSWKYGFVEKLNLARLIKQHFIQRIRT